VTDPAALCMRVILPPDPDFSDVPKAQGSWEVWLADTGDSYFIRLPATDAELLETFLRLHRSTGVIVTPAELETAVKLGFQNLRAEKKENL